jgi:hypothetical protein
MVLEPEDVQRMTEAYEQVLRTLAIVDRAELITEPIAIKIIELARGGKTEPEILSIRTIAELHLRQ